jgi:hypothetical protein
MISVQSSAERELLLRHALLLSNATHGKSNAYAKRSSHSPRLAACSAAVYRL